MNSTEQMLNHSTPFFIFDLDRVREKYEAISSAFPGASIFFAMKANNNGEILRTLMSAGSRFEIGSKQEAEQALELGVSPKDLIFSSPVKLPSHISDTYKRGVDLFVFDSEEELRKLALLAPKSRVLLRLSVGSEGSLFSLGLKFGAPAESALSLMQEALNLGLVPFGLAFHVGSQCDRKETWTEALGTAGKVWGTVEAEGIPLRCMDIGGGFPIQYIHDVPSIDDIAREVRKAITTSFPSGVEMMLEPGRYLVGDSAMLVSSVIGKAERKGENWLYVDASAFHGLMEALQGRREFPYRVTSDRDGGPKKRYVLTGPTCDADDTILNEVWLPEMEIGDRLYIMNTGAYSFVYASDFHGFSTPEIYFGSGFVEKVTAGVGQEYGAEIQSSEHTKHGELRRYFCKHEGQECEVYHGMPEVPDEWIETLWAIYEKSLHTDESIQEQSCYTEESFIDALKDHEYGKIVLVIDGKASGLVLSTNNLGKAKVAYINPEFVRKRFPKEVEEGRFWYATCVFVSPEVRNLRFFKLLVRAAVDAVWEKNYVMGCDAPESRLFVPEILTKLAEETGFPLEKVSLGVQSYFVFQKPPGKEVPKIKERKSISVD